jgi:XTP/dITP diphosphohydrolase
VHETPVLLVATRNSHKTAEIAAVFPESLQVIDLSAVPGAPDVEETGSTFLANARLKALGVSEVVDGLVLADDSGLEVDALGGAPGVRSARYAAEGGDDHANNAKLMREMQGKEDRKARFRCAMVLARDGEVLGEFDGAVEGYIIGEPRGAEGFGYDPFFVPDGFDKTFAELGAEVKNGLSHRARALEGVIAWLKENDSFGPFEAG